MQLDTVHVDPISYVSALGNAELLEHAAVQLGHERWALVNVIATIGEIEERRLHLEAAFESMFAYCQRKLGLSEGESYRRLCVARLSRRFPQVLARIADGRVTLSNVVEMHDFFTPENVDQLLDEITRKTKRQVRELIARLAPKPDVPPTVTPVAEPTGALFPSASVIASPERSSAKMPEPLSEGRYHVSFTASTAFRDKLERVRDLLRHRVPDGDLEAVFDRCLDAMTRQLEREFSAKTNQPRQAKPPADPGHVTSAARREVVARDGFRCSYVSPTTGERCPSRAWLEIDHEQSRALGGTGEATNLRVLCRAHNRLAAERAFGRDHVAARIHLRQKKRVPAAPTSPDPPVPASRDPRRIVENALLSLGFRKNEAQHALVVLDTRSWEHPMADLIRDAIAVLT